MNKNLMITKFPNTISSRLYSRDWEKFFTVIFSFLLPSYLVICHCIRIHISLFFFLFKCENLLAKTSGKHKIVWSRPYGRGTFILGTKKPVMSKKKVFVARNLKDSYQIYHSDQEKQKRQSKFFQPSVCESF
jgi:hypothetical protein